MTTELYIFKNPLELNHFKIVEVQLLCATDRPLDLCPIYFEFTWALATLSEHMYKKFEVKLTKIKAGCQSETKKSQLISNSHEFDDFDDFDDKRNNSKTVLLFKIPNFFPKKY